MVVREKTGARETIDSYKEPPLPSPVTPRLNIKTSQNVLLFFSHLSLCYTKTLLFVTLHFNSSEFDRQPLICIQKAS